MKMARGGDVIVSTTMEKTHLICLIFWQVCFSVVVAVLKATLSSAKQGNGNHSLLHSW